MKVERWMTVVWDMDSTDQTQWFGLYRNEKQAQAVLDDDLGLVRSGIAVKVSVEVLPSGVRFIGAESFLGTGQ